MATPCYACSNAAHCAGRLSRWLEACARASLICAPPRPATKAEPKRGSKPGKTPTGAKAAPPRSLGLLVQGQRPGENENISAVQGLGVDIASASDIAILFQLLLRLSVPVYQRIKVGVFKKASTTLRAFKMNG